RSVPRGGARASRLALTLENEMGRPSWTSHPPDTERSRRGPLHSPPCSVVRPGLLAPDPEPIHISTPGCAAGQGLDGLTTRYGAVPPGEPVAGGCLPPGALGAGRLARLAAGGRRPVPAAGRRPAGARRGTGRGRIPPAPSGARGEGAAVGIHRAAAPAR